MRVAAVIPARLQSVRLPGKALRTIGGVPMVVRVLERARACSGIDRIIVATDSPDIKRTVEAAGGEAWLTSSEHRTGSDRVAEVAARIDAELVLNLQGDEPLLPPSTVARLLAFGRGRPDLTVVTAASCLASAADVVNPNVVKVVRGFDGRALYFSRYPIPYRKDAPVRLDATGGDAPAWPGYRKHIGIYLYRREFLLEFVRLDPTPLEIAESLEQLRILEHGHPVYVVDVDEDSVGVDTPEDLERAERLWTGRESF